MLTIPWLSLGKCYIIGYSFRSAYILVYLIISIQCLHLGLSFGNCFYCWLFLDTWICFENYIGHVYLVELEIKDTTESNTSASYRIRSWVTIYHLCPPMASLSHSLYDMPELASRMDVLFGGRHDFQISPSNRDTRRNAWNRHWSVRGSYQTI